MLKLVFYGNDFLRQESKDIENFDENIASLATEMLNSLERFNGVGLAAVQVGYHYNMFVTDTREKNERLIFINPVIIETSADSVPYNEGCLSLPNLYKDIMRPSRVVINAQDVTGKRFTLEAKGLLARVIQHEYDHLKGKVFIDHLSDNDKKKAEQELARLMKKKVKK